MGTPALDGPDREAFQNGAGMGCRVAVRHAGSAAVSGRLSLTLAVRAVFTPRREGMESNFLGGVCGHRSRRFDGTYDGSHGPR
jgi:hypothetical protein